MSTYQPSPVQPPYQPVQKDSTLAIISLISGISAFVFLPFIGAVAAIILGHLAKKEIRESGGMIKGSGMATAGLILGYIQLVLIVIVVIGLILLVALSPNIGNVFNNINSQLPVY
jgi:hypothetical protein